MSSAPTATGNPPPHEPSIVAAVLSYLIPGLGQIYQGRYGKGVLFMVSLLGMFMLGQAMGQWQNVYLPHVEKKFDERRRADDDDRKADNAGSVRDIPSALVQRWHYMGQFWIGAAAWPALWQYFGMHVPAKEENPFVHNFQRPPDETKLNEFLVNSDKTPDLGWVYTVIAGMLNILVIYDAYAGPVFIPLARPAAKETVAVKMAEKKEGAA